MMVKPSGHSIRSLGGPFSVLSGSVTSFATSYASFQTGLNREGIKRAGGNRRSDDYASTTLEERDEPTDQPLELFHSEDAFRKTCKRNRPQAQCHTTMPPLPPKMDVNPPQQQQRSATEGGGQHSSLCAVFEDRVRKKVGLAVMDGLSRRINLHEYEDLNSFMITLTCLKRYDPTKILLPKVLGGSDSPIEKAITIASSEDGLGLLEQIPRKYYDDVLGEQIYQSSGASFKDEVSLRRCALSALAAVIRYSEFEFEGMLIRDVICITFNPIDNCVLLNRNAIDSLEIFESKGNRNNSTLSSRFRIATTSGRRILSNTLRFPLVDQNEIESRLDVVSYLISEPHVSTMLLSFLIKLTDLEGLVSRFVFRSLKRDKNYLKRSIKSIVQLYQRLSTLSELTCSLRRILNESDNPKGVNEDEIGIRNGKSLIMDLVNDCESEDVVEKLMRVYLDSSICLNEVGGELRMECGKKMSKAEIDNLQLLNVIKQGANSYLDAALVKYVGIYQDVLAYIEDLCSSCPNVNLRCEYSEARGQFLICSNSEFEGLSSQQPALQFTAIQSRGKTTSFSTHTLQSLNASLHDLRVDIYATVHEDLSHIFSVTSDNCELGEVPSTQPSTLKP
eukprot:GHVH01000563.1.p1 GENE.GHVH01000563.1~~GHVH01000563.1.p1  ORF type:complete len:618 (+),score=72.33 GHVH01000563.1:108-1961(+)